jgi:hypothetical protein
MAKLIERVLKPGPVEKVAVEYHNPKGEARTIRVKAELADTNDCYIRFEMPSGGICDFKPAEDDRAGGRRRTELRLHRAAAEALVLALTEFYGFGKK